MLQDATAGFEAETQTEARIGSPSVASHSVAFTLKMRKSQGRPEAWEVTQFCLRWQPA